MLAAVMSILGPILKSIFSSIMETIGKDLVFKKQTRIQQGETTTVTQNRTETRSSDLARRSRLRSRFPVVVLLLMSLAACGSTEKTYETQHPVFLQEHLVANAAIVADDREIKIVITGDDGLPVKGALPAPARIDAKVVVGPVRYKELLASEKDLADLIKKVEKEPADIRKRLLGY